MRKKSGFDIEPEFVGATVLGERGQVVIPISVRREIGLQKGARLLVFRMDNIIITAQLEDMERIAAKIETRRPEKAASIRALMRRIAQ